jgi:hypothetical protein
MHVTHHDVVKKYDFYKRVLKRYPKACTFGLEARNNMYCFPSSQCLSLQFQAYKTRPLANNARADVQLYSIRWAAFKACRVCTAVVIKGCAASSARCAAKFWMLHYCR